MINLLVTVFGGLLLIGGFYGMSRGFLTPPNLLLFFLGLCSSVFGLLLMGLFGSKINFSRPEKTPQMGKKALKTPKMAPKEAVKKDKLETISKTIKKTAEEKEKPVKPRPKVKKAEPIPTKGKPIPKIKPVKSKKAPKNTKEEEESKKLAPVEPGKPMRKITPKPSPEPSTKKPEKKHEEELEEKPEEISLKKIPSTQKISDVPSETPRVSDVPNETPSKGHKSIFKRFHRIKPEAKVKKDLPKKDLPKKDLPKKELPKKDLKSEKKEDPKPRPKHVDLKTLQSRSDDELDDQFVKNRLERLKSNYVENAKEIENIIDERLDSFKGTLDKLKVESQEPNIIWSFDAGDVKDTLNDTISKASNTVLMMYPWVRNIDVGVLKKFMDTDSRMIIQEASLDDDTSVELIKLLMDNNVKIRTMPNVHTVAVVSDDTNGLIISTDPIYESFEVGVVYKDHKSIEEIRRLFEDAWSISKDINLEIKQ
ncbi:hypothetical protein [Methanobacterium paludis]|uniref:DUF308 domain-containing protein n=1 Tax=Methanobacterium paludis (strain DSM 25820 / JCM 18151 / SWAN1) TaxID=868131 RepID=F6D7Z9_METPW|nr:hypothetical protein [Methanobacterium paludis]AEG18522.1 hypothetical protein MSWAN_1508 [Methanobacterium paludis]